MKYITPIVLFLLSLALIVVGGTAFSIYSVLLGAFTFWGMLKIIKRVRDVPLYIEIINYILVLLIIIAKHNVLSYQSYLNTHKKKTWTIYFVYVFQASANAHLS